MSQQQKELNKTQRRERKKNCTRNRKRNKMNRKKLTEIHTKHKNKKIDKEEDESAFATCYSEHKRENKAVINEDMGKRNI